MLHFIPFDKNVGGSRVRHHDCVPFAILLGMWSQSCLIKKNREMKADLL